MSNQSNDPLLEMFIYETAQLLEQLEQTTIKGEQSSSFSPQDINDIFRIMHTIKGSSAMMQYAHLSNLAHSMEDLFYYLREQKPSKINFSELADIMLKGTDYMKGELASIQENGRTDGDPGGLIEESSDFLSRLRQSNTGKSGSFTSDNESKVPSDSTTKGIPDKNNARYSYKAVIHFDEGCEMENIRAFAVINDLKGLADDVQYCPSDLTEDKKSVEAIRSNGFQIIIKTDCSMDTIREALMHTVLLKHLSIEECPFDCGIMTPQPQNGDSPVGHTEKLQKCDEKASVKQTQSLNQSVISVNILKLDKLMDLVGELVISQSMVTQNPDLEGLSLNSFNKAARQLKKITGELQDTVMSIRMVSLSATFHRMHRIVRDMCQKLGKEVRLELIGEETEADKNIIEHITDPLIHLIRNAIDHGIEPKAERLSKGKNETGRITLEAKNAGGDILILIKDDGRGLDREKILHKARDKGLITRDENELPNREIFQWIFAPGFSTNDDVSEYSGRGVGMDIVKKNMDKIGGRVSVESVPDEGTSVVMKIPLTMAIIGGMNISVGNATFIIPTVSIRESFRPDQNDVFKDTGDNEMIMIRGQCYPVLRLHRYFKAKTNITNMHDGIIIMVENDEKRVCLFADALLGEQQVVVKALPNYVNQVKGLAGCTLLGDGRISLILDVAQLAGA